jgi:hypothetical protein
MPEVAIRTIISTPQLPAANQKFFFTTPDGTINGARGSHHPAAHLSIAEDTAEFAYAEPNRLGTQAAYLNVPHTTQKTISPLVLPHAKGCSYGNEPFQLPFPHLEKGDIAFHLRLEGNWDMVRPTNRPGEPAICRLPLSLVCKDWDQSMQRRRKRRMATGEVGSSAMMEEGSQVFVNLHTVNYILHGIQHYGDADASWRDSFWRGFGLDRLPDAVRNDAEMLCTHVVRWCMAPFGVVVSDVSHSSDQSVAIVIDGRVQQATNHWASLDGGSKGQQLPRAGSKRGRGVYSAAVDGEDLAMPEAGDELILVLERMEKLALSVGGGVSDREVAGEGLEEELDRWTHVLPRHLCKSTVRMVFPLNLPASCTGVAGEGDVKHFIWQLVPSVAHLGNELCWERRGFWRLGVVH